MKFSSMVTNNYSNITRTSKKPSNFCSEQFSKRKFSVHMPKVSQADWNEASGAVVSKYQVIQTLAELVSTVIS